MTSRVSHRSTAYPCFFPDLGEFSRSWSYRLAAAKIKQDSGIPTPLALISDRGFARIKRIARISAWGKYFDPLNSC